MSTTTWITAPTDLLGLGGSDVRQRTALDSRVVLGVSPAPRVAPFQRTAAPAGGTAVRLSPVFQSAFAHNFIGTTLGIHPSGRPLS